MNDSREAIRTMGSFGSVGSAEIDGEGPRKNTSDSIMIDDKGLDLSVSCDCVNGYIQQSESS